LKLIVGLGNPGDRYQRTRHNIGFGVVESLAERWGAHGQPRRTMDSLVWEGRFSNERCLLVRPQTFMNRSGGPTAALASYFQVAAEDVVVVHDDLDLPFGTVRCKSGGGHGGHNGLRDLHNQLGRDYARVRCGIGRPPEGCDTASYVLSAWNVEEQAELANVVSRACDATEAILQEGVVAAMNVFNVRRPRPTVGVNEALDESNSSRVPIQGSEEQI
jgi:PTH1 family peptidyl-tRNA hydrolase